MRTLFALAVLAVLGSAVSVPMAGAQVGGTTNLLSSMTAWDAKYSGSANVVITPSKDGVTVAVNGAQGMRSAYIQQAHIPLVLEHSYHFHCMVSSNTNSQIELGIIPSTGMHGALIQAASVTPNWSPIDMDITPDGIGMNDVTVLLYLGSSSTVFRFGPASLVEFDPNHPYVIAPAPSTPTPTVVINHPPGGGWGLEVSGKAQAGSIDSADGPIIDVDQPDNVPADVAYAQEGVDVTNGTNYILHFRARSGTSRTVHVEAEDLSPSRPTIGLSSDVQVTSAWQEFNLSFTAQNVTTGKARIALILGAEAGPIQLAQVQFANPSSGPAAVASRPAAPQPGALVPVATWDLDTQGSTEAMVSPSTSGAVVEIDRADGAPNHITLKEDGVALDDGKIYDLQFKAKASITRSIPVVAQVDTGSVQFVGLNGSIHVTPVWQDYDLKFTAQRPIPAHSRIAFLLGGAAGMVELSDVALQPSVETVTKVSSSVQGQ